MAGEGNMSFKNLNEKQDQTHEYHLLQSRKFKNIQEHEFLKSSPKRANKQPLEPSEPKDHEYQLIFG
jgi:hypothetical protein